MAHLARRYTQDLAVVTDIDDELCPHALIDRSNGLQVRVINANENWPAAAVRRYLRHG
jgi:hypothetical protein